MAKLPDNFFDDDTEATPAPIKVPRGWTTEEEVDDDESDDGPVVDTTEEFSTEEEDEFPKAEIDLKDPFVDEETVAAPKRRSRSFIEDPEEDEPPVVAPKPKKRHAWVEDDYDDEPEEPVLKPRLTVAPDGSPEVHLDDDDVSPATISAGQRIGRGATPMVVRVTEVDDNDEPIGEPYVAPPAQEKIVPVKRLSEKALLVSLNISQWNGRRFDRQVSAEVNASKAAVADAGRFNKVLLPDCAELAEVHRQTSSMRNWFVEKTLPWMNDGARITPSSSYLAFTSEFRARQLEWTKAVDALVAAYPALKARAPQQLQSMFNPEDYPTVQELRRKFGMAIRSFPLPDKADFRVELDAATMDALRASMEDVEGDLARQVVGECYTRLGKAVGAMAERLSQPDAVFRNSLTENLAEAVMALKDLNITGDPKLEALRQNVAQSLGGYSADQLRADGAARKAAADSAKKAVREIETRMAGLY